MTTRRPFLYAVSVLDQTTDLAAFTILQRALCFCERLRGKTQVKVEAAEADGKGFVRVEQWRKETVGMKGLGDLGQAPDGHDNGVVGLYEVR